MKKFNVLFLLGIIALLFTTSCTDDEPDDPVIPNEEEVITSLNFILTPSRGGAPVTFSFQDLDGDGGNDPVITGGTLDTNSTYTGSLVLLNELENPAENISDEINTEALEHQFFFQTTVSDLMVNYDDMDVDGNPIGLSTIITTNSAGNGTITVVLRHEPNKDATGVSTGDITNAGGETDIEVTFNVEIK